MYLQHSEIHNGLPITYLNTIFTDYLDPFLYVEDEDDVVEDLNIEYFSL